MTCRLPTFALTVALMGGCVDGTIGRVWDGGIADGDTEWWDHRDPQFCRSTSVAGIGATCSPTVGCPSYLDCVYVPGCVSPHGTCQRWGYCPDTLALEYGCSCTGETVGSRSQPIESWSIAGAFGGCHPVDAADASDATVDAIPE